MGQGDPEIADCENVLEPWHEQRIYHTGILHVNSSRPPERPADRPDRCWKTSGHSRIIDVQSFGAFHNLLICRGLFSIAQNVKVDVRSGLVAVDTATAGVAYV
jgi:hypothetical protein